MTLENLFTRLRGTGQAAQALILDAGFCPGTGIAEGICSPADDPDTRFLKERAELQLDPLEDMRTTLSFLERPASPEHVLERFSNGHYDCRNGQGTRHELRRCRSLEAKIRDMSGRLRRVMTRMERDGFAYFLLGHEDVPLAGLTVRERGRQI